MIAPAIASSRLIAVDFRYCRCRASIAPGTEPNGAMRKTMAVTGSTSATLLSPNRRPIIGLARYRETKATTPMTRFATKTEEACSGRMAFMRTSDTFSPSCVTRVASVTKNRAAAVMPKSAGVSIRAMKIDMAKRLPCWTIRPPKSHTADSLAVLPNETLRAAGRSVPTGDILMADRRDPREDCISNLEPPAELGVPQPGGAGAILVETLLHPLEPLHDSVRRVVHVDGAVGKGRAQDRPV